LAIFSISLLASCAILSPSEPKVYSPDLLPEERASIVLGKLSPEHEYYEEVTTLDPECADYIQELSIYDAEIEDTFVVHISLPPDHQEGQKYPMVVMTDGVWRLSDHPELRPMMVDGEIEPVILVSIGYPNGYNYQYIRERDLNDGAESFLHFIVDNLIPYLKENFPVDSENMTLTGHSRGGFWAIYAMFNNDTIGKNTFKNFYIGSPYFPSRTNGMSIGDLEKSYYERRKELDYNVYFSVGGEETDEYIPPLNDFVALLKSRNYEGLNMEYDIIEGYKHETVFKPSIRNTLLMFYGTDEK
jgi:enterochelin esterase-like enzyme